MEPLQQKIGLLSDEAIILKVLRGETALFEVLIRRYNPLLYKIARTRGMSHHDAEDVMQETYVAAYRQLQHFRQESKYKTWLTKIHLHHCYHKMNYGYLKYETVGNDLITDRALTQSSSSSGRLETERMIMNKELAKVLEESLQQLPVIYRDVFMLREIAGFSVAETAELSSITPVNVKVRLNRAKTLLQKQLQTYYSSAELYEFHLMYCDRIVKGVFEKIVSGEAL